MRRRRAVSFEGWTAPSTPLWMTARGCCVRRIRKCGNRYSGRWCRPSRSSAKSSTFSSVEVRDNAAPHYPRGHAWPRRAGSRCEVSLHLVASLHLVVWNGRTVPEKGNGGSSRHTRDTSATLASFAYALTAESDSSSNLSKASDASPARSPIDSD